ncbi:zinc finger protein 541 isoform X1 [Astyanax mexicanus]|uniref:zinc finger protein 541 isoform X1 n=1 Tax=Astyanax mexicanus TaxID=7994 RepID=UPI0020CB2A21|nr:zinc finger protein 541 isoform X1 [Astyanax mexicanus]
MSEERACPELHPADQVMEVVDPSDESMPLLSVAENLTDDVIFINQLTPPLPSLEDHLWINDFVSANTEFVPAKVIKKTKRECSECRKVFRTTNALNKHLLNHQPDRPHLCKQRFERQDHLTAHLVTQKKWLAQGYKSGYHKVFWDHHSQKCSRANPTEPSPIPWEHACPPVTTEDPSPSNSYSSNTGFASIAGNLGLNCFPEVNLSQSKLPVIQKSWSLGAVDSNQWVTIDPKAPDYHKAKAVNLQGWEDELSFPVTNPQPLRGVLTVQPCEEENNIGMECSLRPLAASLKKSQPVSLKKSVQHLKPQNNHQLPFIGEAQACSKSDSQIGSVAPQSHQKTSHVPFPPPAKKCKKIKKTANVLKPPPPPAIRPKMKKTNPVRSSDHHTACLISPSQVAMASFSTQNTHSLTIKEEGVAAVRQEGKESGTRTLFEYLPDHHIQCWPSVPQTPTTFSAKMDDQQVENESRAAGQTQECQGFQMSPLVIPVSVPVLEKEAPFHKQSVHSGCMQTKKQQNIKDLSKRNHHPDLLRSLIIPNVAECGGQGCRAAGGYPSQLRSPTYLVDHLLKPGFLHPPYTPPPMLSPVRPGTGLYFNTLPQCQPCPLPPFSYTASLNGTDTLPLMTDGTIVSIEPKINVGPSFQAEIPPLRNQLLMLYEEHPAQLLWAPWGDLPTNPKTQQKVTEFLNMCCSSVLPGGGTNTELALYYLHEVQGDVLAALDLLLLRGDYRASSHPLSVYHFTGSDHWSVREIKLFRKALFKHNKDFQLIHNVLQTKSVAQCVEYYYAMKKLKKFKKPKKGVDKEQTAENSAEFHSTMEKRCETGFGIRSFNSVMETNESQYVENWDFTCQECGRGFH